MSPQIPVIPAGGPVREVPVQPETLERGNGDSGEPIEPDVEVQVFPWTGQPQIVRTRDGVVTPWNAVVRIAHNPAKNAEMVNRYVNWVAPRLPDSVREAFVEGSGMYALPDDDDPHDTDGFFE